MSHRIGMLVFILLIAAAIIGIVTAGPSKNNYSPDNFGKEQCFSYTEKDGSITFVRVDGTMIINCSPGDAIMWRYSGK